MSCRRTSKWCLEPNIWCLDHGHIYLSQDLTGRYDFSQNKNFSLAPDFNRMEFPNQTQSNWDMEHGYKGAKDVDTYPYRVFGTGSHASFSVVLKVLNNDLDYLCSGAIQGFKISIQPPSNRFILINQKFWSKTSCIPINYFVLICNIYPIYSFKPIRWRASVVEKLLLYFTWANGIGENSATINHYIPKNSQI